MLGYVTEEDIRRQVQQALRARVLEDEQLAEEAKKQGKEYKRKYSMAALKTAKYEKWTQDRIASARARGLLVTPQQLADIRGERRLEEGDRVRYIGPSELQKCRDNRTYLRQTGELGRITKAVRGPNNLMIYTFLPDFPKEALEKDGPHVFVAQLQVQQGTSGYFLLERIPEARDRSTAPQVESAEEMNARLRAWEAFGDAEADGS